MQAFNNEQIASKYVGDITKKQMLENGSVSDFKKGQNWDEIAIAQLDYQIFKKYYPEMKFYIQKNNHFMNKLPTINRHKNNRNDI